MKRLRDLAEGDPVIVTDVNARGREPRRMRVTRVARAYLYAAEHSWENRRFEPTGVYTHDLMRRVVRGPLAIDFDPTADADRAAIAHAPTDIANLLAECDRLRGEVAILRKVERAAHAYDDGHHGWCAMDRDRGGSPCDCDYEAYVEARGALRRFDADTLAAEGE